MKTSAKGFYSNKGTGVVFDEVYLIAGKRTPFGKYTGALSTVSPTDLGILASRAVLSASEIPAQDIAQVIVANIGQASADSFFLPRHISLYSGVPLTTPALLTQRICGSGIEVIGQAAEQITLGKANLILGCGTDTMSRYPLVSYNARQGFPLGRPEYVDLLWEALNDTAAVPMGHTADLLAKKYNLSREEVDAFAFQTQERYFQAFDAGFFEGEIAPVEPQGVLEVSGLQPRKYRTKNKETFFADEHPRRTTLEKLKTLPFVFTKEGPTTAGTASGIVDGAASVLVASGDYVRTNGLKPLGKILGVASVGVEPSIMGIGPQPAIESILTELGLTVKDIDLFEINEAFGAQCLSVMRAMELPPEKLNVHGGAIAIGHPLAATGCRLATTCLRSLHHKKKHLGVISACIGGGQGIAMVLEVV